MSKKIAVLCILAVGLLTLGMEARPISRPGAFANYKLTTFQVPGQTQITVTGIDNAGDVVGNYVNGASQTVGFERLENGTITDIVDPNDNHGFDRASGINNNAVISGDYAYTVGDSYTYSGYTYQNGAYTSYQVPGSGDTSIFGINDSGSFTGVYYDGTGFSGLVNVGGSVTQINVPTASLTYPYDINNAGIIVGSWSNAEGILEGFVAKSDGTILGNIEVQGASDTIPNGINNHNEIVGYYVDTSNNVHGFLYQNKKYTAANIPNAVGTLTLGINDSGQICGTYFTPTEQFGFIATPK